MDKKFLHKFTKHLILATKKKLEKETPKKEPKEPFLIKRAIPQVQTQELIHQPIKLEPTLIPEESKIEKKQEKPLSLEDITQTLTKPLTTQPTWSLGRLDQFILDPFIKIIECPGPNKKIKVKTSEGVKETNMILNPVEVSSIVNTFSKQSNTPLTQIFKSKFQNLSITAFISPVSGTKFIILKD